MMLRIEIENINPITGVTSALGNLRIYVKSNQGIIIAFVISAVKLNQYNEGLFDI
jgi:hypothetical protein